MLYVVFVKHYSIFIMKFSLNICLYKLALMRTDTRIEIKYILSMSIGHNNPIKLSLCIIRLYHAAKIEFYVMILTY